MIELVFLAISFNGNISRTFGDRECKSSIQVCPCPANINRSRDNSIGRLDEEDLPGSNGSGNISVNRLDEEDLIRDLETVSQVSRFLKQGSSGI